jgi:type IV pilus assembly protein PilW
MTLHIPGRRSRLGGFSMVELLVGVMIGLIGIVIISQMYAVAEDRKRSATGSSDAQVAGNIAIFSMERSVRMSGWGLSNSLLLGCNTLAYSNLRAPNDFTFVIRPVLIEDGVAGAPDTLTVMYSGSPGISVLDGSVLNGSAAPGVDFPMQSVAGYAPGDLVIAAEATKNCSLAEVTSIPAGTNTIQHTGGNYNKAGGLGITYTSNGQIFKVGRKAYDSNNPNLVPFTVQRYRVVSDVLRMESLIPYVATADADADGYSDYPLANGVVQLQALYGKDDGVAGGIPDDGVVDTFDTNVPADSTAWRRTLVLRLALLIRVGKWERDPVTTTAPKWNGGTTSFVMSDPGDGTSWQNYRYRAYEVDIPLRNMLWKP